MYLSVRIPTTFKAIALCLLLLFGAKREGYGQRIYADVQRNGITQTVVPILGTITASGSVTNPLNSINSSNLNDFTHLEAWSTAGTGTAWQQLIFSGTTIPLNSTVYVKINSSGALLGGGISAQAYSGSTSGTNGNTVPTQATSFTAIDGTTYLAVSASATFNAVRITLSSPVALGTSTANIFYAFYEPPTVNCVEAIGVSTGATGITLGNIQDPLNAVDNNLNTFATFNSVLGLGSTLSEKAYFGSLSNPGDAATVTFSVPPALLSLGLFNNVTINAYRGNSTTPVSSSTLGTLLSLDLLGLLNAGARYTVSFVPSGLFDRVEVVVASGVGLLGTFRIHEIQRTPAKPTVPIAYPEVHQVCYGETTILTATATSPGSILRWYDQVNDGSLLYEGSPFTTPPITVSVGDTAFFYVAAAWSSGCPAESERVKVAIIANPLPTITLFPSAFLCQGETTTSLLYGATANDPATYSITWTDSPAGFINVTDQALTPDHIQLNIPGNAAVGTYSGRITIKNSNGCESEEAGFSVEVHSKPLAPHITAN